MEIQGKTFLVAGGGSGLGAATARVLAENGGNVVIADIRRETGEATANEIGAKFVEVNVADEEAVKNAAQLKLPVLLFHGTADQLTSFDDSKQFAANAGNNVTFIEYKGLYHECHNEPEKAEVLGNILKWCNNLIK